MPKESPKQEDIREANRSVSRPEDPDTQRLRRKARLLRADMLPEAAAASMQAEDREEDSETEAALKRASEEREP
jgi:hypothetical protein